MHAKVKLHALTHEAFGVTESRVEAAITRLRLNGLEIDQSISLDL